MRSKPKTTSPTREERRYVDTRTLAALLDSTPDSIKEGRSSGRLKIPFSRVPGIGVRYDLRDVEAAVEAAKVKPSGGEV